MNRCLSLLAVLCLSLGCAPAACAAEEASADGVDLEVTVVGPEGKAVPEAEVEFRAYPEPPAANITLGTLVREHKFGFIVKADDSGRAVVRLPASFEMYISTPGFAPYWGDWGSGGAPARFTAELDAAWSVGGIVVDEQGAPVEGAEVHPSIQFKNRPGSEGQLHTGASVKTDASGAWRFDCVPESMSVVSVEINHDRFMPVRQGLAQATFGLKEGEAPRERIALARGLTIAGTVTDEGGQPIAGALVRTRFINDMREAKTDEAGRYELVGCTEGKARVVVSAEGRAIDLKDVRVEADMGPLDFALEKGHTLRVRVLDGAGKPVAKARIFFQEWRGGQVEYFEFDHLDQYTDDEGLWVWNEAPADEMAADIAPPEGMQLSKQRLIARDEEFVFTVSPPLTILGMVTDAGTGAPIAEFRAIPGIQFNNSDPIWQRDDGVDGRDGKYRLKTDSHYENFVIRIEAAGRRPAASRIIKNNEGEVTIDFALEPGADIGAAVLTPSGKPAAGARAAINPPGRNIYVENGMISDNASVVARTTADDEGRIQFLAQDGPFLLMVTHPEGYALLLCDDGAVPTEITLEGWARVEGTFRIGSQAMGGVTLELGVQLERYTNKPVTPQLNSSYETGTAEDGRFVFERVFAGKGRVGRRLLRMVDEGATEVTSSRQEPFRAAGGETLRLDLGGEGRPVVGKLLAPAGMEGKVEWSFASINMREKELVRPPVNPNDLGARAQIMAWQQAMMERRDSAPYFAASCDETGAFRIDDVPPGDYELRVDFFERAGGRLQGFKVTVPAMEGEQSDEAVDLGEVQLLP